MVFSTIAKSYFDEFPFRRNDRRKPNSEYFFLSHAHTDHTKGLKGSLTDPDATIVCSRETAAAIKVLHRIPSEKCLIIKPNQILSFDNFNIYVLDANHCLGSLMFVIESIKGSKEIFTGDFRLGQSIFDDLDLLREPDQLWVDFTYGKNPLFQFPSREDLISEIITLILSEGNFPEKNVWISSYQVGKELLFKTISTALGVKIWAPEEKCRIYKEIGGDWDIYTADSESGVFVDSRRVVEDLHGVPKQDIRKMIDALRISPTGWALRLHKKRFDIHFFPYSDHCSYLEVNKFVNLVQAKHLIKI